MDIFFFFFFFFFFFAFQTMDNSKLSILMNWTSPFLIQEMTGVRFLILFQIEIPLSKQFRP